MGTREDLRPTKVSNSETGPRRLFAGFGRTTLVAVTALGGCALLIAFAATLSMCWTVHPLLFAGAGLGLGWGTARVAPRLFRTAPASNK